MDAPPVPRRTPHGLWAAGAVALLLLILWAIPARRPPAPAPEAVETPPATSPAEPTGRAGRVVCGFCNGDGRIDAADRARRAPRLDVPEGPCAACAGKGGR
jgi:hypothetical protein